MPGPEELAAAQLAHTQKLKGPLLAAQPAAKGDAKQYPKTPVISFSTKFLDEQQQAQPQPQAPPAKKSAQKKQATDKSAAD